MNRDGTCSSVRRHGGGVLKNVNGLGGNSNIVIPALVLPDLFGCITSIQPPGLMKMRLTHHQEHQTRHQGNQSNPGCNVPPPQCQAAT